MTKKLQKMKEEKTTIARENAISDMQWILSQTLIWLLNADATQCKVSEESTQNVEVKVSKGRNTKKTHWKCYLEKMWTSLFIQYYMVFSAGGSLDPSIFIIFADDNMVPEDMMPKKFQAWGLVQISVITVTWHFVRLDRHVISSTHGCSNL